MNELTLEKFNALSKRYPSRLPVFVHTSNHDLMLGKDRFLVPRDFTGAQLLLCSRKHCSVCDTEALFLTAGNKMYTASTAIEDMWARSKDKNTNFLILQVSKESTFGQ